MLGSALYSVAELSAASGVPGAAAAAGVRRGRPRGFSAGQYSVSWAKNASGLALSAAKHVVMNPRICQERPPSSCFALAASSAGGRTVRAGSVCLLLTDESSPSWLAAYKQIAHGHDKSCDHTLFAIPDHHPPTTSTTSTNAEHVLAYAH